MHAYTHKSTHYRTYMHTYIHTSMHSPLFPATAEKLKDEAVEEVKKDNRDNMYKYLPHLVPDVQLVVLVEGDPTTCLLHGVDLVKHTLGGGVSLGCVFEEPEYRILVHILYELLPLAVQGDGLLGD